MRSSCTIITILKAGSGFLEMKRYLNLLLIHYRAGLLTEMEYRANFVTSVVVSVGWAVWLTAGTAVFFYHRNTLGGWTFDQILLVSGLFLFFGGFGAAVLAPNVHRMVEHVQKGTMDFVLLKPASSQFLATVTACAPMKFVDLLTASVLITIGLYRIGHWPDAYQVLSFLLMTSAGVVTLYSFCVLCLTLAFWFVRVDNFPELFWGFFEAGRFPISVYRGAVRFALTFVVPIAFLTTFPAAALLGTLSPRYVVASVVVAGVLLFLSTRFWNYAIRFYSSASS